MCILTTIKKKKLVVRNHRAESQGTQSNMEPTLARVLWKGICYRTKSQQRLQASEEPAREQWTEEQCTRKGTLQDPPSRTARTDTRPQRRQDREEPVLESKEEDEVQGLTTVGGSPCCGVVFKGGGSRRNCFRRRIT